MANKSEDNFEHIELISIANELYKDNENEKDESHDIEAQPSPFPTQHTRMGKPRWAKQIKNSEPECSTNTPRLSPRILFSFLLLSCLAFIAGQLSAYRM